MVNSVDPDHSTASARRGSLYNNEDPKDAYIIPSQVMHDFGTLPDPAIERLRTLEDKFKAMELHFTPGLDVGDMCLVPGSVIPQKIQCVGL